MTFWNNIFLQNTSNIREELNKIYGTEFVVNHQSIQHLMDNDNVNDNHNHNDNDVSNIGDSDDHSNIQQHLNDSEVSSSQSNNNPLSSILTQTQFASQQSQFHPHISNNNSDNIDNSETSSASQSNNNPLSSILTQTQFASQQSQFHPHISNNNSDNIDNSESPSASPAPPIIILADQNESTQSNQHININQSSQSSNSSHNSPLHANININQSSQSSNPSLNDVQRDSDSDDDEGNSYNGDDEGDEPIDPTIPIFDFKRFQSVTVPIHINPQLTIFDLPSNV